LTPRESHDSKIPPQAKLPKSAEQWFRVDLAARNSEIRQKANLIHSQASFTIALVGGTMGLRSGGDLFSSRWRWSLPASP
jgi:hypothetical protein